MPSSFMVDHMVVKLGKYLRILGCDAEWDTAVRTHELVVRANEDGRAFLTRNTRLGVEYPMPDSVLVLHSDNAVDQFREVIQWAGLDTERYLFSRCIKCNMRLEKVKCKDCIRDRVHPNVYKRFQGFFSCPQCGTVFWKGSHVANTRRKLGI
ncbi:MAG: Mut7-C RNAse domain-containing protein [Kiritimatiellia bacterium]